MKLASYRWAAQKRARVNRLSAREKKRKYSSNNLKKQNNTPVAKQLITVIVSDLIKKLKKEGSTPNGGISGRLSAREKRRKLNLAHYIHTKVELESLEIIYCIYNNVKRRKINNTRNKCNGKQNSKRNLGNKYLRDCLLYTSPSPRD